MAVSHRIELRSPSLFGGGGRDDRDGGPIFQKAGLV